MVEIKESGLPIFYDEVSYELSFHNGLTCAGGGTKKAGDLKGLLYNETNLNEDEHCYDFYRDIVFEKDRSLFKKYDYRYDITAIMPGTVNQEYKKTSGHYHGYIDSQTYTYPEIYEVLNGEVIFFLQKVGNFDKEEEEPKVEEIKAVHVRAGQAIIIPPFYGHCSVNVGESVLYFSNIAVVSCPMHYAPMKRKHGLGYYALEHDTELKFAVNPYYAQVPKLQLVEPSDCPELGITFGKPVYQEFVSHPEKFEFLRNPKPFMNQILEMTK